jgi:hypothetical protein
MRNKDMTYGAVLAVTGLAVAVISIVYVSDTGGWPTKEKLPEWLTYIGFGVMFAGVAWAAYGFLSARPKKEKEAKVDLVEQKKDDKGYWSRDGGIPCPSCGEPVKPGYARCPKCTAVITKECPKCNEKLPADFKACPKCGEVFDTQ